MTERQILLDVTRLISRSWTRRLSTGIDRVCYAYLDRFATSARAVVQHRGVVRVLDSGISSALFDILAGPDHGFRRRLAMMAPRVLGGTSSPGTCFEGVYLNVGDTDFDLDSHARWAHRSGLRPVYMIHDLIPITHHQYCRKQAVNRHRGRVFGALRHASGIIVGTHAVAQDLTDFASQHSLATPSLVVAPLAGERLAIAPTTSKIDKPYFLCIGTIESRKNHRLLIEAWRGLVSRLGAATPRLVIIGQWGVGSQKVRDLLDANPALRPHVHILSRCTDNDMGKLVADASALLMPTLAEGFGLPMVEALQLGTPVIASDLPCFREIGQNIPTLLPPTDVAAWESTIEHFGPAHPEHTRQKKAMPHFHAATWDHHFSRIENWLPTLSSLALPSPASRPARNGAAGGSAWLHTPINRRPIIDG